SRQPVTQLVRIYPRRPPPHPRCLRCRQRPERPRVLQRRRDHPPVTGDELETTGESTRPEVGGISPVSSFSSPFRDGELGWRNSDLPKAAPGRSPAPTASQGRVPINALHPVLASCCGVSVAAVGVSHGDISAELAQRRGPLAVLGPEQS